MWWRFGILLVGFCSTAMAQHSYQDVQQLLLNNSPAIMAAHSLEKSNQLQSEALKHLGLPKVSLNVNAISYHQRADISLDKLKQSTKEHLNEHANQQLSQLNNTLQLSPPVLDAISSSTHAMIDNAIHRMPNEANLNVRGNQITPSILVSMPIYTGGLIDASKHIAKLSAKRSELSTHQALSLAELELIKEYFDVQLQSALRNSQQKAYQAMQLHVDNANKLEQQGFISKGQRMQFEVARNQALRLYQSADNAYQTSLFKLQSLLNSPQIQQLSSPLFINPNYNPIWQNLAQSYHDAPLAQKMELDQALAQQKISLEQAKDKPKVFAIAQYTLDKDQDWFVGVSANYSLFSGVNHKKQVQAAMLEKQALMQNSQKINQETLAIMYSAYVQLNASKDTHRLLAHNLSAAQENLRIQKLAFAEGMGTVAGVVDAQAALEQVHSEQAINAYRHIIALATLLHHTGKLASFTDFLQDHDNIWIRPLS